MRVNIYFWKRLNKFSASSQESLDDLSMTMIKLFIIVSALIHQTRKPVLVIDGYELLKRKNAMFSLTIIFYCETLLHCSVLLLCCRLVLADELLRT